MVVVGGGGGEGVAQESEAVIHIIRFLTLSMLQVKNSGGILKYFSRKWALTLYEMSKPFIFLGKIRKHISLLSAEFAHRMVSVKKKLF